jgi:soluble lytic murein transglycosylase-like protein
VNGLVLLLAAGLAGVGLLASRDADAGQEGSPADDTDGGAMTDWTRYDDLFHKYGSLYGVPFEWLKAFALVESDLGRDPLVVRHQLSRDGKSKGIMQLILSTARDYKPDVTLDELDDPELSVDLAAQHVAMLIRLFGQDEQAVVMSYNEGQGNFKKGVMDWGYFNKWAKALNEVKENV